MEGGIVPISDDGFGMSKHPHPCTCVTALWTTSMRAEDRKRYRLGHCLRSATVNGYVRPRIFGEQDLVRMGGPASAVAVSTQEIFFEDRR